MADGRVHSCSPPPLPFPSTIPCSSCAFVSLDVASLRFFFFLRRLKKCDAGVGGLREPYAVAPESGRRAPLFGFGVPLGRRRYYQDQGTRAVVRYGARLCFVCVVFVYMRLFVCACVIIVRVCVFCCGVGNANINHVMRHDGF